MNGIGPKFRAAAEKALSLDDSLAQAHSALGYAKAIHDWDWAGAGREFRRALELDPGSAGAHAGYALAYLIPTARLQEAVVEAKKAVDLDPFAWIGYVAVAQAAVASRQYEQASAAYRKALELNPNLQDTWGDFGMVLGLQQKRAEGVAAFERQSELRSGKRELSAAAWDFLTGGAERIYARIPEIARVDASRPIDKARLSALLGRKDDAFSWLEQAIAARDPQVIRLKVDPRFDNLHEDARWAGLLKRMGL